MEEKSVQSQQTEPQVKQAEVKPTLNYEGHSCDGGVYRILNSVSGRYYYGSAKQFKERWFKHIYSLKTQKHHNKFLQSDVNKCGLGSLVFEVVEVVENGSKETRLERETFYLGLFHDKQESCYNFDKKPNKQERSCFSKNPEKTRELISKNSKELWADSAWKEKQVELVKKATTSPAAREKKIEGQKKAWAGDEARREKSRVLSKELMSNPGRREKAVLALKEHQPRGRETYKKRIKEDQELRQRMQEVGRKNIAKRNAMQPVKTYGSLIAPDGTIYANVSHVPTFAKEHGLTKTALYQLLLGRIKSHKGWTLHV